MDAYSRLRKVVKNVAKSRCRGSLRDDPSRVAMADFPYWGAVFMSSEVGSVSHFSLLARWGPDDGLETALPSARQVYSLGPREVGGECQEGGGRGVCNRPLRGCGRETCLLY